MGDTITPLEVPFEIPESWEWVRLGSISTYAETKQKVNATNADPLIWGLDLEDVEKGGRLIKRETVGERKAVGDKTVFAKGDILYSKLRPYLLKILVAPDSGICTPEIVPFRVYGGIDPEYIVNYLKSPYVDNFINSITYGIKMPRVGTETMTSLLVPLPPLGEQQRIVEKINDVEAAISAYAIAYQKTISLNYAFPEILKKSILQQAVQGKLVPQDPADEPAEVLLERIRAEKRRLVREGKIKKEKHDSIIFRRDNSHYEIVDGVERCIDEELPFEIPESWAWAHFTDVIEITTNLVPPDTFGNYKHIAPDNIEKNTGRLLECKTVTEDKVISANHLVSAGCIIYSKIRPLLRKATIAPFDCLCSADMYPLETMLDKYYVMYFLLSDSFNLQVASIASSRVKMPKINQKELSATIIPVPPLPEQHRIVEKVQELFSLCEKL